MFEIATEINYVLYVFMQSFHSNICPHGPYHCNSLHTMKFPGITAVLHDAWHTFSWTPVRRPKTPTFHVWRFLQTLNQAIADARFHVVACCFPERANKTQSGNQVYLVCIHPMANFFSHAHVCKAMHLDMKMPKLGKHDSFNKLCAYRWSQSAIIWILK